MACGWRAGCACTRSKRYEAELQNGTNKATKDTVEIDQAVVPFRLNDDWALITRTKLPMEVLPPKKLGDHWVDGLSNGFGGFVAK
jgi:hypothetical protein